MERSWVAAAVIAAWVWMTIELVVWWWAWWRGREKVTGRLPYRAGLAAAAAALTTLAPVLLPALERAGIPLRGAAWALAAVVALSAVVAARRRALERAVRIRVPATVPTGGTLGIEGELPDLPGGGRVRITVWCERRRLVTTRGKLQREIVWHREVRHRIGTLPLAGGWRWVRERIGIPEDGPVSARGQWERVVWRVRLEAEGRRRVVADRPFEVVPGGAAEEALVREAEEVIAGFGEGEGPDLPPGAVATATGGGWRLEHRPLAYAAYLRRSLVVLAVAMAMTAVILGGAWRVGESVMAAVLGVFGVVVGLALLWSLSYVLTLPWRRVRFELEGDRFRWRVGWVRHGEVPASRVRGVWAGLWSYAGVLERGEVGPEDPRLWLELDGGRKRYLGVVGLPEDAPMLAEWLRWKLGCGGDDGDDG